MTTWDGAVLATSTILPTYRLVLACQAWWQNAGLRGSRADHRAQGRFDRNEEPSSCTVLLLRLR